MNKAPKRYTIATLFDFNKVPPKRMSACLADFTEWVALNRLAAKNADQLRALGILGMVEKFEWVDDGISGISAFRILADDPPPRAPNNDSTVTSDGKVEVDHEQDGA